MHIKMNERQCDNDNEREREKERKKVTWVNKTMEYIVSLNDSKNKD